MLVAETANHLVLLPESVEFEGLIVTLSTLTLSLTSTYEIDFVLCGSIDHVVPLVEDLSDRSCPVAPCSVSVPVTVCVVPAVNVSVAALVTVLVK